MKLRISRDELLTGLQRVQGVVEKRNTMPILSNILLEAKADGVDILATDLEIGMRGLYKAAVEEPGSVTLSARKLYEILKELKDGVDGLDAHVVLGEDPGDGGQHAGPVGHVQRDVVAGEHLAHRPDRQVGVVGLRRRRGRRRAGCGPPPRCRRAPRWPSARRRRRGRRTSAARPPRPRRRPR